MEKNQVILDVSARHVHLRPEDVEVLFGKPDALTLRQNPQGVMAQVANGMEVFNERVAIVGPKGSIKNVTILGPLRNYVQVEVSKTDARMLGVDAPIRKSGNHEGSPGIEIVGPCGSLKVDKGCIVARRHIHMSIDSAAALGIKHGDAVRVEVKDTERSLTFGDVFIEAYTNDEIPVVMHLDTDEANAANIKSGYIGTILP